MDINNATDAFSALSQHTRLEVYRLLLKAGDAGMLAGEIGERLDVRQNTMSSNLSVLANAGLLRKERQGRTIRYFAKIDSVKGLLGFLMEDCCGGNPLICQPFITKIAEKTDLEVIMLEKVYNVLFLCTGNSARSIIAEALLNRHGNGKFAAFSAGSHPKGEVHPQAVSVLQKSGFKTDFARSKDWSEFAADDAPKMDFVFTVCDNAASETCPVWPGQPMTAHWGVPDPAVVEGSDSEISLAFADTFRMLESRISIFCSLPLTSIDGLSLQNRLDEIGKS